MLPAEPKPSITHSLSKSPVSSVFIGLGVAQCILVVVGFIPLSKREYHCPLSPFSLLM